MDDREIWDLTEQAGKVLSGKDPKPTRDEKVMLKLALPHFTDTVSLFSIVFACSKKKWKQWNQFGIGLCLSLFIVWRWSAWQALWKANPDQRSSEQMLLVVAGDQVGFCTIDEKDNLFLFCPFSTQASAALAKYALLCRYMISVSLHKVVKATRACPVLLPHILVALWKCNHWLKWMLFALVTGCKITFQNT